MKNLLRKAWNVWGIAMTVLMWIFMPYGLVSNILNNNAGWAALWATLLTANLFIVLERWSERKRKAHREDFS